MEAKMGYEVQLLLYGQQKYPTRILNPGKKKNNKNTEFSMTKINLRSYFDCYVDNEKRN